MKNCIHAFRLSAISAALLAVYGSVYAQADEAKRLISPESVISVGVGQWSDDRAQQGIFDGMRDNGTYGLLDLDLNFRDDATGTWYNLYGRNLGLDTRELSAEWLRQGNIGAKLEYSRTPREHPLTIMTGLQGIGTANMVQSGTGAANTFPMREVQLGTHRDLLSLGFYKNLLPGLDLKVSFKNEEKDGTRHWGRGSAPTFAVEPINSTTRQLETIFEYTTEKLQMSGGYYGSWYDTANPLAWVSTQGTAAGSGTVSAPNQTPLTMPLDNQAHQLFFNGGYSFTPTTRATMKLSYAKATQNETLPTWGLGGINARFIGAPSKLDGRIDTTTMELGLNSRPIKNLSIVASLRYNDVDDKTPLAGFVGNNTTGAITVHNTPHSIKTHSGKLEGTYRLPDGISLVAGFDVKRQDRSAPLFESERYVPFRTKLDEDTYRIQLRKSMSETVNGTVAYLHSKRDGSSYLATEHFPSDLINPLHIADRQRDKWRASVDWTPINNLSLQGTVEDSRDDYGTSASRPYGLTDGNASMYSIDATYVIKDTWSVSTWFAHDKTAAKQLGARWDRVTERYEIDKEHRLRDQGDSFGVGVRGNVSSKFKMGAEYQRTRNTSDYRNSEIINGIGAGLTPVVGAPPTTARNGAALPDIENKLDRFTLFAEYTLNKQGDIRVDLIHERWRTDDWTWMMLPATGLTAFVYGAPDSTSVMAKQKQSATFIGARYIYKFQ